MQHEISRSPTILFNWYTGSHGNQLSYLMLQVSLLVLVQVTEEEIARKKESPHRLNLRDNTKSCLPDASSMLTQNRYSIVMMTKYTLNTAEPCEKVVKGNATDKSDT